MSINIGFRNNSYSIDDFTPEESMLVVNTFHNSNAILVNTDKEAFSNCVMNFRDMYASGLINNKYAIYDIKNMSSIIELSSNIAMNSNIIVRDLIYTTSNLTVFNSNVNCFLKHANDKVRVYDTNKSVAFEVNTDNTSIKNVKIQNTLYVDRIQNYSADKTIDIINPNIIGLVIQTFNTEQAISVKNVFNQYYSSPTILVNRYDNLANIMQIGTCNIYRPEIVNQFIIDRKGNVGIGPVHTDARLSISQLEDNPLIIKYKGNNNGDIFNLMANGSIGVGISEPKALMHISRSDDLKDDLIRKDPIIQLDIQYNGLSNISYASNIQTLVNKTNLAGALDVNVNIVKIDNVEKINTSNYYNSFYLGNTETQERYRNITLQTSNIKLRIADDSIMNLLGLNTNIYRSENVIYYHSNMYAYERPSAYSYLAYDTGSYSLNVESSTRTSNFVRNHLYNYGIIVMSKDTYNYSGYVADQNNPRYNADRFVNIPLQYSNPNGIFDSSFDNVTTSNFIHNIYFNINVLMEDINHKINYKLNTNMQTYNPPYFMYLTSNSVAKGGISGYGCLSLGSLDMSSNKYVLYADGTSFLQRAEINEVFSSNQTINFNNVNISNINVIHCSSNIVNHAYINNAYISNVSVVNQICSNLETSNLVVQTVDSSYFKMSKGFVNYNTYLSVTNTLSGAQINNDTLVKFSSHNNLSNGNPYFKNYKALTITNDANTGGLGIYNRVNPSLAIVGYDGSIPYLNLSRGSTEYFVRIHNRSFGTILTDNTDIFEICCDNISDNANRINFYTTKSTQPQPSFINHIKKYNLLTFGELHNVCINCTNNMSLQSDSSSPSLTSFTNGTNKIALGYPYGIISGAQFPINDWPKYFDNNICSMTNDNNQYAPYMLNVFGNMGVFSIHGKTMMTIVADNGKVRDPLVETIKMIVGGDIQSTGNVDCLKLNQSSDSNIKTDLKVIENALQKVNAITGYTYTNTLTSDRQAGLIAQEVQQVLPEVVGKNNDGIHTLAYGNIVGLLVESIKDLSKKFDIIERRLSSLEDKMNT
jgi:hypothetical protein